MKNRVLFLDWHNTLSSDIFFSSLRSSSDDSKRQLGQEIETYLFKDNPHIVEAWMRGELISEEVISCLCEKFNIDYSYLWAIFVQDCKEMNMPIEIKERLTLIRKSYFVVLITANMDCFRRFTVPNNDLSIYFDSIINSSDSGYLKTDFGGKAFKDVLMSYDISPVNATLIDDSRNVGETFKSIGGIYYQVNAITKTIKYLDQILASSHIIPLPFPFFGLTKR